MKKYTDLKWQKIHMLDNKETKYTNKELSFLYILSKSKNTDFRIIAAELLVDHYTKKTEDILYHMTFDKEYLVKLNAVDSLCIGKSLKSLQRLKYLMDNDDYMIRGYAIMSYCDVYFNITNKFDESVFFEIESKLTSETSNWVKAIIFKTLYIYGYFKYLDELLELFNVVVSTNCYEEIWSFLNIFNEILNEKNKKSIISVLKKNI